MPEPKANILVAFCSRDGSIEALAKAISEAAREAGAEVRLRRVPDEEERRPAKSPRMEARQYRLVLYGDTRPQEYDGDETFTFSYLRTRLRSDAAAQQILDEVKRDGTAARQFKSPGGNMTRVVISLR